MRKQVSRQILPGFRRDRVAGGFLAGALLAFASMDGFSDGLPAWEDAALVDAAALVKLGRVYPLAITTGPSTPTVGGRSYAIDIIPLAAEDGGGMGSNKLTAHDDKVTMFNGIGTQIDGLAHVGVEHVYHGGIAAADLFAPDGVREHGLHTLQPIVGRGVLLDVAALKQVPYLPGAYEITRADLLAAMDRQNVQVAAGNVVLVHTGWLAEAGDDADRFIGSAPGIGKDAARLLSELAVVAVGSDTWGLEVVPAAVADEMFPVHQHLLTEEGIYLLENIWTQGLADDAASEFLFVLAAPRLQGSVQTIVHPVAIR